MKIGILGAGSIGATLARKLSGAGHDVKVANSRGPETISSDIVASGARPVEASSAVTDVDVLITSMPLSRMPEVRTLITDLPANAVIIDTSNYYPLRDGRVEALEDGQVESVWITEQLGRPVAKAWNAITAESFEAYGRKDGDPERIAIPVAADGDRDKAVAMALVEETGFDAVDAGSLADSWRQQPGAPSYCTDFTRETLREALAAAEKARLPQRRDIALAAIMERFPDYSKVTADYLVRLHRAIYS
ncbi:NADPH-dependent F420 reductase [Pseudarthrobacter sp. GA104]|uniref:NADPH-dependent F420 reductase n=1 Tax=Pseudarthrobacter sp. GA104 TaxID=2676311 RepID=UPI0012F75742|nr:NAD(P)-binding domain-containing protein [Pseudarthrobacter sp. GA104]MUU69861.1 NADP oxidoreductase [Pseudarthrobacter sp. GA104]